MHPKNNREITEKALEALKSKDIDADKTKYIAKVKVRNKMTHLTPKKKKRK